MIEKQAENQFQWEVCSIFRENDGIGGGGVVVCKSELVWSAQNKTGPAEVHLEIDAEFLESCVTRRPCVAASSAARRPAGPPPMTAIWVVWCMSRENDR